MITPILSNEPTMEFATFLRLDGMLVRRIVSLVPPSAKKNRWNIMKQVPALVLRFYNHIF